MESIQKFAKLMKEIPIEFQSAVIKKDVWEKIDYTGKSSIEKEIFGTNREIEISRKDILEEKRPRIKIVKVLMWGYPSGGRGKNIENILRKLNSLCKTLSKIQNKDLPSKEVKDLLNQFEQVKGLGISTWSKLLFFFNVYFNSRKCQIFDLKIVESLNKNQFQEFNRSDWKQTQINYMNYIELLDSLSRKIKVPSENIEAFLFHYNLNYKFL